MADITEYIEKITAGEDLSSVEAGELQDTIFSGEVPSGQVKEFLLAMNKKGETVAEIAGLAASLRRNAVDINIDSKTRSEGLVDTCGTGGAKFKTFNISTASAFVAAGARCHVAKHGNRAITSNCGSADVLAALGVEISPGAEKVSECIDKAGVGFMFAPNFHPAMKYVGPVRKEIGVRTVFNILGPLANPAFAQYQVMGVGDSSLLDKIVNVLPYLSVRQAMVVHSDGLDELSTMSPTEIRFLLPSRDIINETIDCEDFGIEKASIDDLRSGDAVENAEVIKAILDGTETGAKKDIVVLNAAAAIMVAQFRYDTKDDFQKKFMGDFGDAIVLAKESIESGKAKVALDKMIEISNS